MSKNNIKKYGNKILVVNLEISDIKTGYEGLENPDYKKSKYFRGYKYESNPKYEQYLIEELQIKQVYQEIEYDYKNLIAKYKSKIKDIKSFQKYQKKQKAKYDKALGELNKASAVYAKFSTKFR